MFGRGGKCSSSSRGGGDGEGKLGSESAINEMNEKVINRA
jgi:hypothetical protein